jgi:hypothetical protein
MSYGCTVIVIKRRGYDSSCDIWDEYLSKIPTPEMWMKDTYEVEDMRI